MSFFNTLGRKGKKSSSNQSTFINGKLKHSSTPNLHKIKENEHLEIPTLTPVENNNKKMNSKSYFPPPFPAFPIRKDSTGSLASTTSATSNFLDPSRAYSKRNDQSNKSGTNFFSLNRKLMKKNKSMGYLNNNLPETPKSMDNVEGGLCSSLENPKALKKCNSESGIVIRSNSSSDEGSISNSINSISSSFKNYSSSLYLSKRSLHSNNNSQYSTLDKKSPEEVARIKLMLEGAKKFNFNQKKGIEYLIAHEIIQNEPDSIAQYLKDFEGLNKSAIGNYLGEHSQFNQDVLQSFVKLHDFTGVSLVQALRDFLWSFRLPGEAQKIDRMMCQFAKQYCHLNPNIFTNTDTCYILSFSLIMLNTSLHNPSVSARDKTTVAQFIKMNRDIDDGKSLEADFLTVLYYSISNEPFKIPPNDENNDMLLTFTLHFNPEIEGWLLKETGNFKTWKKRYFIINNNCLYYFKLQNDKVPREIIPLENIKVKTLPEKSEKFYIFALYKEFSQNNQEFIKTCKTLSDGSTVPGKHSLFKMGAGSESERKAWMTAINQNISNSQFYTILAEKKRRMQDLVSKRPAAQQHGGSVPVIRKSQISLPFVQSIDTIDNSSANVNLEFEKSPKNPHNFFLNHNIANIYVVNKDNDNNGISCSSDEGEEEGEGEETQDGIEEVFTENNIIVKVTKQIEDVPQIKVAKVVDVILGDLNNDKDNPTSPSLTLTNEDRDCGTTNLSINIINNKLEDESDAPDNSNILISKLTLGDNQIQIDNGRNDKDCLCQNQNPSQIQAQAQTSLKETSFLNHHHQQQKLEHFPLSPISKEQMVINEDNYVQSKSKSKLNSPTYSYKCSVKINATKLVPKDKDSEKNEKETDFVSQFSTEINEFNNNKRKNSSDNLPSQIQSQSRRRSSNSSRENDQINSSISSSNNIINRKNSHTDKVDQVINSLISLKLSELESSSNSTSTSNSSIKKGSLKHPKIPLKSQSISIRFSNDDDEEEEEKNISLNKQTFFI